MTAPQLATKDLRRVVIAAAVGNVIERSEEHTSELQSRLHLVCRLLLEKKKKRRPSVRPAANGMTGVRGRIHDRELQRRPPNPSPTTRFLRRRQPSLTAREQTPAKRPPR